jgi:hypothetical protein
MITQVYSKKPAKYNWPRYIGLVQSDGHVSFSFDSDGTFHPQVHVSISPKRPEFIKTVVDFLTSEGFIPLIVVSADPDRATNIVIDRQGNCKRLFEIFNKQEQDFPNGAILFDAKLVDFKMVEQAMEIHSLIQAKGGASNQSPEVVLMRQQLGALKVELSLERVGPKPLSRATLASYIGLKELDDRAADTILSNIKRDVENLNRKVLGFVRGNGATESISLFLAGVWDGDGSFQFNFITHVDKKTGGPQVVKQKNKSPWVRRFIELKPIITLTDKVSGKNFPLLYDLCSLVFEQKDVPSGYKPGENSGRYVCNSIVKQQENVIPLFEKHGHGHASNIFRFRVYKLVFKNLEKFRTRKSRAIFIIKFIYSLPQLDVDLRKNTCGTLIDLVEKQFNLKK